MPRWLLGELEVRRERMRTPGGSCGRDVLSAHDAGNKEVAEPFCSNDLSLFRIDVVFGLFLYIWHLFSVFWFFLMLLIDGAFCSAGFAHVGLNWRLGLVTKWWSFIPKIIWGEGLAGWGEGDGEGKGGWRWWLSYFSCCRPFISYRNRKSIQ